MEVFGHVDSVSGISGGKTLPIRNFNTPPVGFIFIFGGDQGEERNAYIPAQLMSYTACRFLCMLNAWSAWAPPKEILPFFGGRFSHHGGHPDQRPRSGRRNGSAPNSREVKKGCMTDTPNGHLPDQGGVDRTGGVPGATHEKASGAPCGAVLGTGVRTRPPVFVPAGWTPVF